MDMLDCSFCELFCVTLFTENLETRLSNISLAVHT